MGTQLAFSYESGKLTDSILKANGSLDKTETVSFTGSGSPTIVDTLVGSGLTLTENILFNGVTVADFTDSNLSTPASDLQAIIAWGDGTQSAGKVTGSDGSFAVSGAHLFAGPGQDDATITLSKVGSTSTATASTTLTAGFCSGTQTEMA